MSEDKDLPFTVLPFRRGEGGQATSRALHNEVGTRSLIRLEADNVESVVDQSEAALIRAERGLYQRGGAIVTVADVKMITHDKREVPTRRIRERGDFGLLEDLCAAAAFERYDGRSRGHVIVEPSMKIIKRQDR